MFYNYVISVLSLLIFKKKQVGRGPIVGEDKFLNYLDKADDYFVTIGLASGDGNSAAWRIQENAGTAVICSI